MVCSVIFLSPVVSLSATYYVSLTGNDSNPGTEAQPLRTIQKAANIVEPGDTVLVKPGDYGENVSIMRSGSAGAPIIFKGDGPVETIKTKSFSVGSWDPNAVHYITIDNFMTSGGIGLYGSYNIVQNCIMEGYGVGISWHPTAHPPATGCVVRNNIMRNFGDVVLNNTGTKTTDCIFENNIIYNGTGDVWRLFGSGHIIRNNEVYDLREEGWHADIFQVYDSNLERSYDIIVENNYFHDSTGSMCMMLGNGYSEIRDWTFRNNIFYNVGGVCQVGWPGFKFYNNHFLESGKNTAGPLLFRYYEQRGEYPVGGHRTRIFNNFFIGSSSSPDGDGIGWYHFADRPRDILTDFQADYNYVTKTPTANYASKSGFSGQETHGINGGDPKFVDYSNKDFQIKKTSPAIDAGTSISSFNYDKIGILRPQGAGWDIGAYEYKGESASPSQPRNLRIITN